MNKKSTKVLSGLLATSSVLTTVMGATTVFAGEIDDLYAKAYSATEVAEQSGTQVDINAARAAVRELNEALKNDEDLRAQLVGGLSERLDPLQQAQFVAFYDILYKADKVTLKESLTQAEINEAREYITAFNGAKENEQYVPAWSSAVDVFQQNNVNVATAAVKTAEETKKEEDVKKAEALVAELLTAKDNKDVTAAAEALKIQIEELKKAIEEENAKQAITSIAVLDTNQVEVKLNKAVEDTSKVSVVLKQGKAIRYTVAKWAEDKKSVVLEAPSAITAGDYTVEYTEGETVITEAIKIEAEVVSELKVKTSSLRVMTGSSDSARNIEVEVYNQYGKVMKNVNANDVYVSVHHNGTSLTTSAADNTIKENVVLSPITLVWGTDKPVQQVGNKLNVVASYKGITTSATVSMMDNTSIVDMQLGQVSLDKDEVRLEAGDNAYLPISFFDNEGKEIAVDSTLLGQIDFVSSDKTIVDPAQISYDATTKLVKIPTLKDGNVTITAVLKGTSVVRSLTLTVNKVAEVATVTMNAPTSLLAEGETFDLNVKAFDQYGAEIKNPTIDIAKFACGEMGTVSLAKGKYIFTASKAGSVKLEYKPADKVLGAANFTVEAKAVPTAITSVNAIDLMQNESTVTLKKADLKVVDQYGRAYDLKESDVVSIEVKNAESKIVTIVETTIDADGVTFTADATKLGKEAFTIKLANGATAEFAPEVVKADKIASYTLEMPTTVYSKATSKAIAFELIGKTAEGKKVALNSSNITLITSSDKNMITVSGNTLSVVADAKGKSTIIAWNGATKLATVEVNVSDEAMVLSEISFNDIEITSSTTVADLIAGKNQAGTAETVTGGKLVSSDSTIVSIGASNAITVVGTGNVTLTYIAENGLSVSKVFSVSK